MGILIVVSCNYKEKRRECEQRNTYMWSCNRDFDNRINILSTYRILRINHSVTTVVTTPEINPGSHLVRKAILKLSMRNLKR